MEHLKLICRQTVAALSVCYRVLMEDQKSLSPRDSSRGEHPERLQHSVNSKPHSAGFKAKPENTLKLRD